MARKLVNAAAVLLLAVLGYCALRVQSTGRPVLERQAATLEALNDAIEHPPNVRKIDMPRTSKPLGYSDSVYLHYPGPSADLAPHYDRVLRADGWIPCSLNQSKTGAIDLPIAYMKSIYEVAVEIPRASVQRVDHNPDYSVWISYRADEGGRCPDT